MVKPIGHLTANLKTSDKVGHRVKAKFGPKPQPTSAAAGKQEAAGAAPARKPRKFKTRKK